MDKLIDWLNDKFTHPLVPLFFVVGCVLILLGISTGLNIGTAHIVIDSAFRWTSLIIGCIFVILSIVTYYVSPRDRQNHYESSDVGEVYESSDVGEVQVLIEDLVADRFLPNVIIGIARGGLSYAVTLAEELKDPMTPVISLWPRTKSERVNFDNPFNNIGNIGNFNLENSDSVNILIIDDVSISGDTLYQAKRYVERSIDEPNFKIETAAITCTKGDHSQKFPPTYCVHSTEVDVRDRSNAEIEKEVTTTREKSRITK